MKCWIRRSKTDQVGRGVFVFLRALQGLVMCPVKVLREYPKSLSLLLHADLSFLSKYQFIPGFHHGGYSREGI